MIWLLTFLLPIVLALVMPFLRGGPVARGTLLAAAALPAVALAWIARDAPPVHFDPLMLGADFALDPFRRMLLAFTSLLWAAAGWHAGRYFATDPLRKQFDSFFLFSMAGNFGVLIAADAVTFYGFFVLMTLSVHGLIMHDRGREALHAAKVYWYMAIGGEVLLLGGLLLAVHEAGTISLEPLGAAVADSPKRDLIVALALSGFGVKVGILPLYFWLPLAHTVAPTPASAVLSGAMLKAGLVGWVNILPLGHASMPVWSGIMIGLGVAGAFAGAAIGFLQSHPKTVLAYSSVSQMGIMTAITGTALASREAWPAVMPVLALYACVHGLAKGALFLESAELQWQAGGTRRMLAALAFLPALAIAGAPPTGGFAVKDAFKKLSLELDGFWGDALPYLLPFASLATTLVLGRFLWTSARGGLKIHPPHAATLILLAAALAVPFAANQTFEAGIAFPEASWHVWRDALWPVIAGVALLVLLVRKRGIPGWSTPPVPPGDLVVPLEKWFAITARAIRSRRRTRLPDEALNIVRLFDRIIAFEAARSWVERAEARLETWLWVGVSLAAAILTLSLLFLVF